VVLAGSVEDATALESHGSSGVTFEAGTNWEVCVDKPMDDVEAVSGKDELIVPGFRKENHETEEFAPIILIGVLDLGAQRGNCELGVGESPFAKEEGLSNKGVKDFGFFQGQLWGSGMEVHSSWGRGWNPWKQTGWGSR